MYNQDLLGVAFRLSNKTPYKLIFPQHVSHFPNYLIITGLITLITVLKSCSPTLCSLLQSAVTSSIFVPNIFLGVLFSKTDSLCSNLEAKDQASHPYTTM